MVLVLGIRVALTEVSVIEHVSTVTGEPTVRSPL